jgi:hypothetical protein
MYKRYHPRVQASSTAEQGVLQQYSAALLAALLQQHNHLPPAFVSAHKNDYRGWLPGLSVKHS